MWMGWMGGWVNVAWVEILWAPALSGKKKGESNGPPPDGLACRACDLPATLPTTIDSAGGLRHRSWALSQWWGPFCSWCIKVKCLRWPWLNAKKLELHVDDQENKQEFKLYSWGFVSLREDGHVHISVDMLERRVQVLRRFLAMYHSCLPHVHVMPVDVYQRQHPQVNPINQGLPFLQLVLDGKFRLGLEVSAPTPQCFSTFRHSSVDPRIQIDDDGDISLLNVWAQGAVEVAVSTPSKKRRLRR